jgi:endonuclease YncB( thermonuclease family)
MMATGAGDRQKQAPPLLVFGVPSGIRQSTRRLALFAASRQECSRIVSHGRPGDTSARQRVPHPMTRIFAALVLCALCKEVAAEPARVVLVVDGDTLYADVRGQSVKIRVNDLDTPEVGNNAKCEAERLAGERASAFAKQIMPAGKAVDVQPTGRREKYGRLLAAVIVDGRDYAAAMIAAGHGVRYDGRRKPDWCRR